MPANRSDDMIYQPVQPVHADNGIVKLEDFPAKEALV